MPNRKKLFTFLVFLKQTFISNVYIYFLIGYNVTKILFLWKIIIISDKECMRLKNYFGELKDIYQIDTLFVNCSNLLQQNNTNILRNAHLNLSGLSFVSPLGAIALLLLLEKLNEKFKLSITPPDSNEKLVSYLERIDFFKLCPINIKENFENSYDIDNLTKRIRHDTRKVMLELTRIKCYEDVDTLYDSIIYILKNHGVDSSVVNSVGYIATELGTNIIDHSEGNGYASIQYYPSFKKVIIGIGDNGVGVINKINSILSKVETNLSIISHAFMEGTSTGIDRGYGLTKVREFSFLNSNNTKFFLRTHNGIYQVFKDSIEEKQVNVYFPGTYFLIEINF